MTTIPAGVLTPPPLTGIDGVTVARPPPSSGRCCRPASCCSVGATPGTSGRLLGESQWTESPVVIPIPGSSRPDTIQSSVAAADLHLTAEQTAQLDAG
jgi:hypothetical protein